MDADGNEKVPSEALVLGTVSTNWWLRGEYLQRYNYHKMTCGLLVLPSFCDSFPFGCINIVNKILLFSTTPTVEFNRAFHRFESINRFVNRRIIILLSDRLQRRP